MSYFKCCLENRIDDAIALINSPAKLNAALRICSYNGNYDAVQKLLELGADPNAKCARKGMIFIDCTKGPDLTYNNYTPAIELAAMNNHAEIVKLMLNDQNVNSSKILFYFVLHRNIDMVKYLFKNGMSFDKLSGAEYDESPIKTVIDIFCECPELFKYFIEQGLDVNSDRVSHHFSNCYKNESMLKLLMENGFDVNNFWPDDYLDDTTLKYYTDLIPYGMNFSHKEWPWSLCMACESGEENVVRTLLDHGVDMHNRRDLPYKYAAEYGQVGCLKLLVEKDPLYLENNKQLVKSLLSLASKGSHMGVIQYLDDLNLFCADEILLFGAAEKGNLELVKYHISKGADPRAECDYAMRIALLHGHVRVADFLIGLGCDPAAKDNFSMLWAMLRGESKIIDFLKEKGIDENNFGYEFTKKLIKK